MPILLILLGLIIRNIAIRKIKNKAFLHIASPTVFATNGIYKKIRHPMYLGSLILFLGICLLCSNWKISICLTYLSLQFILDRIDREERMMVFTLGKQYVDYMKRTKMLIPFIF